MKTFFMFLAPGKQAHKNQSHYDQSGYNVFNHGCHSGLAYYRRERPIAIHIDNMLSDLPAWVSLEEIASELVA